MQVQTNLSEENSSRNSDTCFVIYSLKQSQLHATKERTRLSNKEQVKNKFIEELK